VSHIDDHHAIEIADRVHAWLSIILASVVSIEGRTSEDPDGVREINPVLANVGAVLRVVPLESAGYHALGQTRGVWPILSAKALRIEDWSGIRVFLDGARDVLVGERGQPAPIRPCRGGGLRGRCGTGVIHHPD
jgi:hypothetical protein